MRHGAFAMAPTSDATTMPGGEDVASPGFTDLAQSRAILLTTFRRNGDVVAAPVWFVVRDGVICGTTPADSGKVKRMWREPRVEIAPCTQWGTPTGLERDGRARVMTAPELPPVLAAIHRRYLVLDRLFSLVNRLQRVIAEVALEIREACVEFELPGQIFTRSSKFRHTSAARPP